MPTVTPMDFNKDMPNHPEISQLIRVILNADPIVVAEGNGATGPYVIISAEDVHFTFRKTETGYTFEKTK